MLAGIPPLDLAHGLQRVPRLVLTLGDPVLRHPDRQVGRGEDVVVELGPTAKPRADFFERLAACWTIAPPGAAVESLPFVVGTL